MSAGTFESPGDRGKEYPTAEPLVLVVDGMPADRHKAGCLIKDTLGWKVTYAANGLEALASMEQVLPKLVITDLLMPEMDGLQLLEEIRRRFPLIPVILMTAKGNEEIAYEALRKGAASCVPKKNMARFLSETLDQILKSNQVVQNRKRLLEGMIRLESEFTLETDPALIPSMVNLLQDILAGMNVGDENTRIRVGIALEEGLVNAMYHGNLEVNSELLQRSDNSFLQLVEDRRHRSPYRGRRIYVRAQLSPSQAIFTIRDEGPGFDPSKLPDPTAPANLEKASGRGLLLIRAFMDEVHHNKSGNQITMIKNRPGLAW